MTDYTDEDITMKPEPDAPHVALAACVQGQHITKWEYDVLAGAAFRLSTTTEHYIQQLVIAHVIKLLGAGDTDNRLDKRR